MKTVKPGDIIEHLWPFAIQLARNVEADKPRPYLVIDTTIRTGPGGYYPTIRRAHATLPAARRHAHRLADEYAAQMPQTETATAPAEPEFRVLVEFRIRPADYLGATASTEGANALVMSALAGEGIDLPKPTRITAKEISQ